MNWQEIMNQVLEINDLQEQVLLKSQNEIIKEIVKRNQKYLANKHIDITSLNNAVLEHKLMITPYQVTILEKINNMSLTIDIEDIYANMPKQPEEIEKYIIEIKKKYQLAINCFDLIMNIEKMTETEYDFNYSFEDSIYAKKVELENKLLFEYVLKDKINLEKLESIIISNQHQFLSSLKEEEKKQLMLESLVLSYERNVFDYFNGIKVIPKIPSNSSLESTEEIYNIYQSLLLNLNNQRLSDMSLNDIYNHIKIIYETDLFKEKIKKK